MNDWTSKLLWDEELEDKENVQVNSDITNKYKRKWNIGGFSRNISDAAWSSYPNSSYQHSLLRNKDNGNQQTISANYTSLDNIPELSFTRSEVDIDIQNNQEERKTPNSDHKKSERKIYIVSRDRKTPDAHHEDNLLWNEDLDLNLLTNEENYYNFGYQLNSEVANPEMIGIPSDLSQFERKEKSDISSNLRGDEGFDDFIRWGDKFINDSDLNTPVVNKRKSNDNLSFTFTKKDEKSPWLENSKLQTDDSKFEQLEIEEWSPNELPSVNMPKRYAMSGAGVIFEKQILDKAHYLNKTKSSRNSTWIPESRSHKASIVLPKVARDNQLKSPTSKAKMKPYSETSDFQWGNMNWTRSRNPSKSNNYFTTGNRK